MDSLEPLNVKDAAFYVAECRKYADLHTITLTIRPDGGTDVLIQGIVNSDYDNVGEDYVRKYVI